MTSREPVVPSTELVKGAARDHLLVRRVRLLVEAGPDAGKVYESERAATVIGNHESADLFLTDKTVSRFHCELAIGDGRISVRDLGSSNGTVVDGVQVIHALLRGGETLTLGNTELRFDLGADHSRVPLAEREAFGELVGSSSAMRAAFVLLERAAASDATVLLEGETGTGKEAAAESIHQESARRDGPFVVVDCSAIPSELLESELFGHEKGSFTGAHAARDGSFEAARGGTIFLDEVGEMPTDLQPKLLRVLERREVKRVGSDSYHPVDVRVIAATNRNLRQEVNERRFRSDLYYRLAVLVVRLPALRERPEDLPLLVENLVQRAGAATKAEAALFANPTFLAELGGHSWPGNVRELRNYVDRCVALQMQAPLDAGAEAGAIDIPVGFVNPAEPLHVARDRWNRILERRYLEALLAVHGNNVSAATRAAGMGRSHFYRLLWRHGLR